MEENFSEILKEFLQENNIRQNEFAEKIGVKSSQVSEWLRGKASPGYYNLRAMAKAYGIPSDYFLGLCDSY